jgi:hypothetical protein
MNEYVLQVKNRLPVTLRSHLGRAYHGLINFIAAIPAIARDTRVLFSHLSADLVPGYYWWRIKRFVGARS